MTNMNDLLSTLTTTMTKSGDGYYNSQLPTELQLEFEESIASTLFDWDWDTSHHLNDLVRVFVAIICRRLNELGTPSSKVVVPQRLMEDLEECIREIVEMALHLDEETCAQLGRNILHLIVSNLYPELLEV